MSTAYVHKKAETDWNSRFGFFILRNNPYSFIDPKATPSIMYFESRK